MYLHIGNGKSIRENRIIGIFDLDSSTVSPVTRAFLKEMENAKKLSYLDDDLPRAYVLCDENNECRVYLTRISGTGLKERYLHLRDKYKNNMNFEQKNGAVIDEWQD